MKKKYILLLATAALIAVAAIGGTLASGYVESGNVLQNISEKALGISIMSGNTKAGDGRTSISVEAVPGASNTVNYQIKNDRSNGYDLYARVDLYYGWSSDTLVDDQTKNSYVNLNLDNQAYPYVDSYTKQTKVGTVLHQAAGAGRGSKVSGFCIIQHRDGQPICRSTVSP